MDIVQKLTNWTAYATGGQKIIIAEARDEIERLNNLVTAISGQAYKNLNAKDDEIERLREALSDIANIVNPYEDGDTMQEIARAALKGEE